jgi:hypothetical protein
MRSAASLLAAAHDASGSSALLEALGFRAIPRPDRRTARAMGLADDVDLAALFQRDGLLRALSLRTRDTRPLREVVGQLAPALAARAPQFAWLLFVVRSDASEVALSTWAEEGSRVRHAALVFHPQRTRDSDAETLVAMAAAAAGDDSLVHLRWHEILGRQAVSARFYRALEQSVTSLGEGATGAASSAVRRELALIAASRLLFLSFLQTRGWLDGDADFLARQLDAALASGGHVHQRFLDPLFFGTLNTRAPRRAPRARAFGRVPFLNGGLFARTPAEVRHRHVRFRDSELAALFDDVLARYRFTPREDRPEWSEAAIDPEMLGRAFESLMASRERRDSGAFYTPHALVVRTTDAALDLVLAGAEVPDAMRDGVLAGRAPRDEEARRIRDGVKQIRVLDPACGSGAFLVHVLERISGVLQTCGDDRPLAAIRRHVLTRSIFGVDINPMAVWLCELRLWLSVVIESDTSDPMQVPPLPNLDRNVRLGDALSGGAWSGAATSREEPVIAQVRGRYARATGRRKAMLARTLDAAERRAAIRAVQAKQAVVAEERRELLSASRGRDLFGARRGSVGSERQRRDALRLAARDYRAQERSLRRGGALPFRFASHFADVQAAGGFDLVIGNPPWVRLHRIPPERRDAFRREFRVYREAAWQAGAVAAGAGAGFAAQVDLAALFAERAMELVRQGGITALLLPMKLWRSLAGGGVRNLLATGNALRVIEDWSEAPHAFDAAVYPSLVVAMRAGAAPAPAAPIVTAVHRKRLAITWRTHYEDLALDASPGAPWLILPPDARRVHRRIADLGVPLAHSSLGAPTMGVKCGCNDAFLVRAESLGAGETIVATARGNVRLEADALRPVLRGEQVRRWRAEPSDEWTVWTHGVDGRPLPKLAPAVSRWLARWRGALAARSDARGNGAWWSLFRVDGASADRPRVVWADVSRGPRACVLPAGSPFVPLNTCYILRCRDDTDAAAVVALLNSPLMACWLDAIAEPARGGFRRYMGWTIARMPVPRDWARAREILAPIGARAVLGDAPGEPQLLEAACDAFGISTRGVRPLVEWAWR